MVLLKNLVILRFEIPTSLGAYTKVEVDGTLHLDLGMLQLQ